jgi:hypothetical protein
VNVGIFKSEQRVVLQPVEIANGQSAKEFNIVCEGRDCFEFQALGYECLSERSRSSSQSLPIGSVEVKFQLLPNSARLARF